MGNIKNQKNWTQPVTNFINSWKTYFSSLGVKDDQIIVTDIYNLGGSQVNQSTLQLGREGTYLSDLSDGTRAVVDSVLKTYAENISFKETMLSRARELYDTDTVQTIIDIILDDGFNSFKEDSDFQITYELDPDEEEKLGQEWIDEVQEEVDDFVEKSGIKDIIADIAPDVLRDGEHALALRLEEGKGVTGISDDIDVANMLSYHRGNKLCFVLEKTEEQTGFGGQEKIRLYNPDNIVFFRLKNNQKKPLNLGNSLHLTKEQRAEFEKKLGVKIPKYIRICLPIYYSAMDSIETLQAMQKLNDAQQFVSVLRPQVLGVGMPNNASSEDAKKALKEYERHLNDAKSAVNNYKDLDLDAIIDQAKERKLLPLYGDGKGAITPIDINTDTKADNSQAAVQATLTRIALNVGVPPYCLTLEGAVDKQTTLKLYSRYTKKLTSYQKALADGTIEILHKHLTLKGILVEKSNLKARFKPLTNGDFLDDIDMMVAAVTGLADLYDAAEKIANSKNNNCVIDDAKLKEVWDTYTSSLMNISGLIKIDEDKFDNEEFEDEDMADFGGPSGRSRERLSRGTESPETSRTESPEIETETPTTSQEQAIDNANAESMADFVNSTSAEL